ncbi:hypothetical protein [Rhodobaculum claviforme]|nr:hypothetical protein [Rhodobaculum claviforme]
MAAGVTLAAVALPRLPLILVVPLWLTLGLAAAVPGAANTAVARGHALKTMRTAHPLHRLRRGGLVRVTLWGAAGILAVAVLLVRLSAGGAPGWMGAAAGVAAVVAVMWSGRGMTARLHAPVHADARLRRHALLAGTAAVVVVSGLAGWWLGPGDPALTRPATSALIAEAFEAQRLWVGVEAWALGAVTALGLLPPMAEAVLAALLLGVSGGAVAALAVAALMQAQDWRRAVATSSDAQEPPPAPPSAVLAVSTLTVLVLAGAFWSERQLFPHPPEARPMAQLQTTAAERIGTAYYPAGTHAEVDAGRATLAAQDAAALAELRTAAEAGFDAMLAGVDPFLDGYYSLRGEYWRMGVAVGGWVRGDPEAALEAHLAGRLNDALDSDTHLGPVTERLALLSLAEARAQQAARETALLGTALSDINPARLRVEASFPALAPLPELRSLGLSSNLETRLGGSVAMGVLGAVVARRVLQRLVQRGILRLGARALLATVPLVGTALAVGTDVAALKLEEHYNRADFRAEIVAALEEQRASFIAAIAAPSED